MKNGLLVLIVGFMLPSQADAQWWGVNYHASTPAESYARGMADVIRSQGAANMMDAAAASEFEDARAKNIQNRVDATSAYFERKQINQQYQSQQNAERRAGLQTFLNSTALQPLSNLEYNATTGQINWPSILREPQYDQFRAKMDELHRELAQYGGLTGEQQTEAELVSRQWREQLTANRDQYQIDLLRQSIRFILRLDQQLSSQT